MKALELIKELVEIVEKKGDCEVKISLLTENDDYNLDVNCGLDYWEKSNCITITHDFDDYNEFKNFKKELK